MLAPGLDPSGQLLEPVRLVALEDADRAAVAEAVATAGVAVGVCRGPVPDERLLPLLDLTLVGRTTAPVPREGIPVADVDAAAADLVRRVAAAPRAAAVLAGLLRWSGGLPVTAALEAESLAYSTLLAGPEFAGWLGRRGPRVPPPAVAVPVVRVERSGGRLRITLDRPERRNAYGRQLRDALVDALAVAAGDPSVESVLLDGAGPDFCSGGDLGEFGTAADPATAHLVRTRAGAARLLAAVGPRLEARLHGSCVGAGVELPAWAARVVATRGTRCSLPELGMGLLPGAGGTVSIPRRIGRWRTLWLALSGAVLDAPTALAWGLVDELVDEPADEPVRAPDPGGRVPAAPSR